jgi:hypothetical protein
MSLPRKGARRVAPKDRRHHECRRARDATGCRCRDRGSSTDDADPQSQILYEVYLNGVRNDDGVIGYGSTVTYCREPGPTAIVLRAVDTSGNRSGASNAIDFAC